MKLLGGRVAILAFILLGAGACATYRTQLAHGQQAFDRDEYDRALAVLRDLEPDVSHLSLAEQAQYAYLRGMSDYRIGYRADARHWLALASAHEDASPGALPADWKARATAALDELNVAVYAEGMRALATARHPENGPEDGRGGAKP